jgi:hypothetical protein
LTSSTGAAAAAASSGVTAVKAIGPLFGASSGNRLGIAATAFAFAPLDRSSRTAARLVL